MQPRYVLHLGVISSVAAILVAWAQVGAPKTIRLEVDGVIAERLTRQVQVAGLLKEAGVPVAPGDLIDPSLNDSLSDGELIRVAHAVSVTLTRGAETQVFTTTALTLGEVLAQAATGAGLYDTVLLDNKLSVSDAVLPARRKALATIGASAPSKPPASPPSQPMTIEVHPTVPLYVHDSGFVLTLHTVENNVGAALTAGGVTLGPGDVMTPPPGTELGGPGQHVFVRRATALTLAVDGAERQVYSFGATVKDALEEAGVVLGPRDMVTPHTGDRLRRDTAVQVVRVNEDRVVVRHDIPYQTRYVPDNSIEIGQQQTHEPGVRGLLKQDVLVRYEDGRETSRTVEREWTELPAQTAVVHYGTKVVLHTLQTEDGPIEYWKTLRVFATWYAPANAGKPRSSPGYGRTALGYEARKGIVAVDPRVIPLRSQIYVPGYGVALAADTGGGVRGNMIDLAYGDDEVQDWRTRTLEIYILGPGPDPSQIRPPQP